MAAVLFWVMMELFRMAAKASFEGAKIVTFWAAERVERSCGLEETRFVRVERDGWEVSAAVMFIVWADEPATRAARGRWFKRMVKVLPCETTEVWVGRKNWEEV